MKTNPALMIQLKIARNCLDARLSLADAEVVYGEWGDSRHFDRRRGLRD